MRESLAQRPGGSAIVRSLGDTLLVLLLRMLLGEQQPPGGLLRLMSDERLMPAVLAVMATPEQPWTLESMAARAFLSRATFARHFARVYHLTPQAWLSQLRMALAARLLRPSVRPTSRSLPNAAAFSRWRPSRSASKCAMA